MQLGANRESRVNDDGGAGWSVAWSAALREGALLLSDLLDVDPAMAWPVHPVMPLPLPCLRLTFADGAGDVALLDVPGKEVAGLGLYPDSPLPVARVLVTLRLKGVWPVLRQLFGDGLEMKLQWADEPQGVPQGWSAIDLEPPRPWGRLRAAVGPRHAQALLSAALRRAEQRRQRPQDWVQLDFPLRLGLATLSGLRQGDVIVGDMPMAAHLGFVRLALAPEAGNGLRQPRGAAWIRARDGRVEQLIPAVAAGGLAPRHSLSGTSLALEVLLQRFRLPFPWTELAQRLSVTDGQPISLDGPAQLCLNGATLAEVRPQHVAGRLGFEVVAIDQAAQSAA